MGSHLKAQLNPQGFLAHLEARGLVQDVTPGLKDYLKTCAEKKHTPRMYIGFDPSAASLQVGNLLPVMLLRRAQLFGVQPVALFGGATGLIGDPSGKKEERNLLDKSVAEFNLTKIKAQLESLLPAGDGLPEPIFVNNYDWFKNFNFLDFLRDVGKHITVNYMIAKDSVKIRMETGISYAEFGYMLIQGYDFLHLFEKHKCHIQAGGSDQWGNITTGLELIRRKHQSEGHAVSVPLLTDAAGNKLGKSEKGTIFLDPALTSPYQFYQFWLQTADADAPKLLKHLTLLDDASIKTVEDHIVAAPERREAQKVLAKEITSTVHGAEAAEGAVMASEILFPPKGADVKISGKLGIAQLQAAGVPHTVLDSGDGLGILDMLVKTGQCKSKGEARRLLTSGAVTINRQKVSDEATKISASTFAGQPYFLLGVGKSNLHLVLK